MPLCKHTGFAYANLTGICHVSRGTVSVSAPCPLGYRPFLSEVPLRPLPRECEVGWLACGEETALCVKSSMMFLGSQPSSKAPLRETSSCPLPLPAPSGPPLAPPSPPSPSPPALSPAPLPCWATQALCDLARGERELRLLRERQAGESEGVGRGLERAVLGRAGKSAACWRGWSRTTAMPSGVWSSSSGRTQRRRAWARPWWTSGSGSSPSSARGCRRSGRRGRGGGGERARLQQAVADLTQPWEITLSLKRVSFRPSSQPKPITFGEIGVQEHSLTFPVAACSGPGAVQPAHAGRAGSGGGGRTPGQAVSAATGRV
ncbi:hypothetical protein AAFF_G00132560, partial [Aldrovandia affinis]